MIPRPVTDRGERIISTRDIKFTYEDGPEALRGINLDIRSGEYVALVGGNGSGKTTLAKHMNGLLRPSSGSVEVMGKPTHDRTVAELSRVVGYAFQNPDHQLFCSTVDDELAFGPRNRECPPEEVARRVEFALDIMGLRDVRGEPPLSLSLGERRKVSIGSIIAMDPKVLILDEPTMGLDAAQSRDLMAAIRKLNDDGHTIILITHEMKLVAEHVDRVIIMANGRTMLDADVKGAFTDLAILGLSKLVPPPVSKLAHTLAERGVSKDILSPEELVFELMRLRGGP
jgi:energy-coupling factor transport system ATP-binding protein